MADRVNVPLGAVWSMFVAAHSAADALEPSDMLSDPALEHVARELHSRLGDVIDGMDSARRRCRNSEVAGAWGG